MYSTVKRTVSVLCLMLLFSGCAIFDSQPFSETAFSSKESAADDKETLDITLAVHDPYCKETACSCVHEVASRQYKDVLAKLKKEHNINLKLVYFMEPYVMEKELVKQKYDGVICKPWMAYIHVPEYRIPYKRIVDVLDPENNQWLTGVFMVKKDSLIVEWADISGKTLVMGQKDAYEKYNSPLALMKETGTQCSNIINKASCIECIGELLDGNADVAVVSDYVMSASCAVDIAKPENFRILGATEKIPLTSVILDMSKVNEKDALRLQKALLAVSGKKSPESMLSKGFVLPASWTPELPVTLRKK